MTVMRRLAIAILSGIAFSCAAAAADETVGTTDSGHATFNAGAPSTDNGHAAATGLKTGTSNKPASDPNGQHDIAPEVAARADGDTVICHDTPIVGSRMTSRLCLTKRRWAQMRHDGQDFIRNIDERSSGGQERRF